ncbi:MAG: hypothetical protein FWH03_00820 [Firmicutes bacterium]|nr:hypothetical protein [Bacillota bacterium]
MADKPKDEKTNKELIDNKFVIDCARVLAYDLKRYAENGGDMENITATKVYSFLEELDKKPYTTKFVKTEKDTATIRNAEIKHSTIYLVGKFSILWNVFEDEKCTCACNHQDILLAVKNISETGKVIFRAFAKQLKERMKEVNPPAQTVEQYVSEYLYPTVDQRARISATERKTYIGIVIDFINSNGEKSFDGALLAIWRIRNNMFHGLKWHGVLDSQVGLFKAMCSVLEEVIK